MSKESRQLARDLRVLSEQIDQYKSALVRLKARCREGARRLEEGEEPVTVVLEALGWADQRRAVEEASNQFEAVRRHVRLGMCAVAVEEGASMAELARALGVSRQLTHRLYNEVITESR